MSDQRVGVLEAVRSRWPMVLAATLILGVVGGAFGLIREPSYTATARLLVGVDVSDPTAVPGALSAAEELADVYARSIDSEAVVDAVAARAGISAGDVTQRVSASPVVESPVIRVVATGPSSESAARLANLARDQLQRHFAELGRGVGTRSESIARLAREAIRRHQRSAQREQRLAELAADAPTRRSTAALREAERRTRFAALESEALAEALAESGLPYTAPVERLDRARGASSDRLSTAQLLALAGLLAGLLIGGALATLSANRAVRPEIS